jgi:CBS domain-containing protein
MDVELLEIRDFLASHHPFDLLPGGVLDRLPKKLSVRYFRRGLEFPPKDADQAYLYILRRGAVELRNPGGDLLSKLAEGDLCTTACLQVDVTLTLTGTTAEDTLCYLLTCADLAKLRADYPDFATFFDHSQRERLRKALDLMQLEPTTSGGTLMTVNIRDFVAGRKVTSVPLEASIRAAATAMSEDRVASIFVMDGEHLAGIITDRDLRTRCIAAGLSFEEPVTRIMTTQLHTITSGTLAFHALITMTRLNVHHLPVLEDGRVIGMLSTSDLVRFQSANSVYMVGDIRKARDLEALVALSAKVANLQVQLVRSGATTDQVGQAVSAVTDAITTRLLEMAEQELGAPPVPYAWMAAGSQARREQSSHSDQDNALLIADHMKPEDDAYFAALARIVNDGLNACGYVYCPGNVMASNPKWRQPLRMWRKYFNSWIERPEPLALMHSSIFFDLRAIHDPEGMVGELREHVLDLSRANRIFIGYMVANALKHRPPLGFFRNFVLVSGGNHDKTLDLKHRGTVPIIDMARVYALTTGQPAVNTTERLEQAAKSQAVSQDGAANLIDALELIGALRLRHQAEQLRQGKKADNFLAPDSLSGLERGHLKDAFSLINTMQDYLEQRYQAGRFG